MKKVISLISLVLFAVVAMAQDKTVNIISQDYTSHYRLHNAGVSDTLTANQDTVDYVVRYTGAELIKKVSVKLRYDVISGADTTVNVSVFGKEFEEDGTYVQIIGATTSSAVAANNTVQILASDYTETIASYVASVNQANIADADTITFAAQTITPLDKSYRYYRIRVIYDGPDFTGAGIKIDQIEVQLKK
jgi:hypothetical protein